MEFKNQFMLHLESIDMAYGFNFKLLVSTYILAQLTRKLHLGLRSISIPDEFKWYLKIS